MEYDQITVVGEGPEEPGRIVGWQDGGTVARITWNDRGDCARECPSEEGAIGLLRIIDQSSPRLRLVSAELVRLVTPQDLTVAIAPGNRKLVAVGTAELERCACADQMVYTFTAKSSFTTDTIGPLRPKTRRNTDVIASTVIDLYKKHPDAEISVDPSPNPVYRPDCLQLIAENSAYVEYVGPGRSGANNLYCHRCAKGIWGD